MNANAFEQFQAMPILSVKRFDLDAVGLKVESAVRQNAIYV
jgi:hypothetical protein